MYFLDLSHKNNPNKVPPQHNKKQKNIKPSSDR